MMRSGGFAAPGGMPAGYSVEADARATFATERDDAARTLGDRIKGIALATLLVGATVGAFLCGAFTTPFRYGDALAVIVVAILPVEIALACFFIQDHPLALVRLTARARVGRTSLGALKAVVGLFLVFVLLPANAILYANQALDSSPGVAQTLVVRQTWSRSTKHGHIYYAGVAPEIRSPLRFTSFYGDQPIAMSYRTWRRIAPGHSTLTLTVHPGLFGLAWYERAPTLVP